MLTWRWGRARGVMLAHGLILMRKYYAIFGRVNVMCPKGVGVLRAKNGPILELNDIDIYRFMIIHKYMHSK